ncbi:carboxypeptidase regulatory-like domain-containing protein [Pyxidicoccus parkwayensis]|uniref:Carboxypeptidase regulatory-like domain-containing protein n=1 Tax=Pyxidicoccus parkwayensis TaxID=2813578 RepID=A0ABX7NQY5_9BACT|nr:carboxypeptidase regulatory-like domain-containing protein [Pyxidicoccus parkwaysis]QSQ21282.1 carboxypeptidase regulatory-like domain-containing protein [Pyxidicoccus parkwaysis]
MSTRRWMSGLLFIAALLLGAWALLHSGMSGGTAATTQVDRTASTTRAPRASNVNATPRPNAGLRIRGTVVDMHGAPAAGVQVSASQPEPGQSLSELPCPEELAASLGDASRLPHRDFTLFDCALKIPELVEELVGAREGEALIYAETTTGADGTFLLEALPEGPLTLWALGEHGAVLRPGIPAGTEDVQLVLEAGRILVGTVVGEGAPVPGATVTVFSKRDTRYFDTTTGSDGRFRIGPLPGRVQFAVAMKDGWLPTLDYIEAQQQELKLHRAGRLSGQVLSGGAPVPGTRVRVAPGNVIPGDSARGITTDSQGRFSLVLPVGSHSLSASHEERFALAHVTVDSTPANVVLALGSALHVEGTVSDDSRRPVAGARLTLMQTKAESTSLHAVTGSDGRYRAGPVEPGVWLFDVSAPGYLVSQASGEHRLDAPPSPVDITLLRAASVTGLVTDAAGQPLPDIQLVLIRPGPPGAPDDSDTVDSAETDAEGRFILDAEEAGDYRIDNVNEPFLRTSFPVRAPSSGVHLTLRPGASVAGTVVDSHGLPLRDFLVELQAPEEREERLPRRYDSTDARGRFLLRGVEPGRYLLLASDNARDLTHRVWREVELRDGQLTRVELRMEPERTLSALVVDGSGQPVADVFVRAHPPQEDAPSWKVDGRNSHHGAPAGVQTGADGRVTLRGLTEATYDVRIRKPGYTLDTGRSTGGAAGGEGDVLRVGADTAEVRLVLKRKAHIVGRVVGPDGAPVRRFEVNGQQLEDVNGAFAEPLTSYSTSLVIEAEGLAPLMRGLKPLQEGADVNLGVLRMHRARTLHGRVVDAETSEPIPSAVFRASIRPENASEQPRYKYLGRGEVDGTFALHGVDSEPFDLTVSHSGHLDQQLTVSPEQEVLTVRMDRGAHVEVTVKDLEGRPLTARVVFNGDDGDFANERAEKGQLIQRGLEPGPYTVTVDPARYMDRNFPVFIPRRVVVPASGRLQLLFEPRDGGTTVKLRVPDSRRTSVALVSGSVPPLTRVQDLDRAFGQSMPGSRTGDEYTFLHVPAGRATLLVVDPEDESRVHREELDVPPSGTLAREVAPVWQTLASEAD